MRVLLGIAYKGTAYCGWQRQKNGTSIQQVLMQAWHALTGEDVVFHGSGRTDSGVHALCQCAHYDTSARIPCDKIPYAFNTKLPPDVRVLWAVEVAPTFHARYDVWRKTYIYRLYWGDHASPFLYQTHAHVVTRPDVDAMRAAAALLVGEHDFRAMQATGGHVKTTVRTIYSIDITQQDNIITFAVCGNGFLYNMVRILVGTLVYVGWGWLDADTMVRALELGDRTALGKTMDACGLNLAQVQYEGLTLPPPPLQF